MPRCSGRGTFAVKLSAQKSITLNRTFEFGLDDLSQVIVHPCVRMSC